jgi:hypothetical protein
MPAHDELCPALTPANLKLAEADTKQYSIDHEPIRWSKAHLLLSQHYVLEVMESSGPTRLADKGIKHTEEALKVITQEHDAPSFAVAQVGLARLYLKRVAGNRTENLAKALGAAKSALRACNSPNCPPTFVAEQYAIIGSIYADDDFESSNSRAANEDLAIRHYLASLQRSSMHDNNESWADRQKTVGRIYSTRKNGKRRSNLKLAVKHLVEALKVFTKSKHRNDWARTHEYLALSYSELCDTSERAANFAKFGEEYAEEQSALVEKCIVSSTNALQVFTPAHAPTSW